MSDVEARLRRVLHDMLDSLEPDRGRGATIARRARRTRLLRGLAAGVTAAAVVAGGIVTAGALVERGEPHRPFAPGAARGIFSVDLGEGPDAVVAVDALQRQMCFGTDYPPIASSVTLRRQAGDASDPVVSTFVPGPASYAERKCSHIGPTAARSVIDAPEAHYVRFEVGEAVYTGTLEPRDPAPGGIPYEAEIVCGPSGAMALTPLIRPQHDGVHLTVYNFGGDRGELYAVTPDGAHGYFRVPPDRLMRTVLYFPPGPLQIGCPADAGLVPFDAPGSERHAQLEIVDRYGQWAEPELECGDGARKGRAIPTGFALPGLSGVYAQLEELIHELVPGVLPDDVIERPGYPDAPSKIETRTVVRDGRRVGKVWLTHRGNVWTLTPWGCPGSGIGEGEG